MLDIFYFLVLAAVVLPSSVSTQCDQFHFGQLCSLYPISAIVDLIPGLEDEQGCQEQCLFNLDCNNFTFVKLADGNTDCFLLRECPTETSCADTQDCRFALTGPKTPSLINACCDEFENKTCGKEFEIDHFYGVNEVAECQGLCQDTTGCNYWSLHGDICFLYSKCGTPESCSSCSTGPVFPDIDSCSPTDEFFDTLVIGGTTSFETYSTSLELVTTEQVCTPQMEELPVGRYSDAATVVGSMIFLCGGDGRDKSCLGLDLDQEDHEWKLKASMVYFRVEHGVATIGDAVFASGGANETTHDSVEVFTQETGGWRLEERLKMNGRRRGHCSVAIGSWLFIIGGLVDEQNTNSVEAFDTSSLAGMVQAQWIQKTNTIYERFLLGCQVATFEGEEGIYAGGGKGRDDVWNTVEFYSVAKDAWRAIGSLNRARNSFAMSLVGQQVNLLCGEEGGIHTIFVSYFCTIFVSLYHTYSRCVPYQYHMQVVVSGGRLGASA